ncbi:transcription repressor NadR [Clostridium oryzae]|uniref:Putative transcription repressor NiaR n=1 Tax=Clostridium oryzae TaxID=1450648 RepID=A0A1V4I3H6_9CLOT|nr:transcription repressor NadR [Clostridium oryzae]OPJ54532.1 putative transcription repressor NiaR [Clostridium oryzae]
MTPKDRRDFILDIFLKDDTPQKGNKLAVELGVTRQVIVKDIAILRAEGNNIIATPEGYIIPKTVRKTIKRMIAVNHSKDDIEEELKIIIKYGAIIEDVIVEHPVYGEIKGMLMIKSLKDLENFIKRFNSKNAEPISGLTGGIHIHTIDAENESVIDDIKEELRLKGFLASD